MSTRLIETRLGLVEYADAGAGKPILYFHGTGVAGDDMVTVESRMVDDGFWLIIPNRPGYGETPLLPHDSAVGCAHVFAALLDSLDITRVSVMGSSGGAAFAVSFAVTHPERVESLVLLCPQLHRWDDKRWLPATSRWTMPFLKRPLLRRFLLGLYRIQLPRMSVRQFLKTQAAGRFSDVADDPQAEGLCKSSLAAMARGIRCPGFENDFVIFLNEDVIRGDGSLTVPTLVIHDELDPMAPVCHVEWFVSKVPHCKVVSLHSAGHLIWAGPAADNMHLARVQFLKKDHK